MPEQLMQRLKTALTDNLAAQLDKYDVIDSPTGLGTITLSDVAAANIYLHPVDRDAVVGYPAIVFEPVETTRERLETNANRTRHHVHTIAMVVLCVHADRDTLWRTLSRTTAAVIDVLEVNGVGSTAVGENTGEPYDVLVTDVTWGEVGAEEAGLLTQAALCTVVAKERRIVSFAGI